MKASFDSVKSKSMILTEKDDEDDKEKTEDRKPSIGEALRNL